MVSKRFASFLKSKYEHVTVVSYQIALRVNCKEMGVPYERLNDPESRSFINLREYPEEIPKLPEINAWPELEEYLRSLNSVPGNFQTLGCGAWLTPAKDDPSVTTFTSYLNFCLYPRPLNETEDTFYRLFHWFAEYLESQTLPQDLFIFYDLKRTDYDGDNLIIGWSVDVQISGIGNSADEARSTPNFGYSLLTRFLTSLELA